MRPPKIELASVEAFACLDLSKVGPNELDAYGGDIQVWFYSILLPEWFLGDLENGGEGLYFGNNENENVLFFYKKFLKSK